MQIEAINQLEMNTNSQDIMPHDSVSQIDDMNLAWVSTSTASSIFNTSAPDAITIASLKQGSVSGISLPSAERYLLMSKDEVTVARARHILAVYYSNVEANNHRNRSIGLFSETLKILLLQKCGHIIMRLSTLIILL